MNKTEDGFRFKLNKHRAGLYNTVHDEIVVEEEETSTNWNIPSPEPLRHTVLYYKWKMFHSPILIPLNPFFKM
jgi:hypothetical protein